MAKVVGFWLQQGVSGFRMDAAPFVIEDTRADRATANREYTWLDTLREHISWRRGDVVVLAEANVDRDELPQFFGYGHRLHMLFNFALNERIFLALARQSAAPIREALRWIPTIPDSCGWATFLRLHDEVDLSRLSPERYAIRTPMQWSDRPNAGFSSALEEQLIRPVIAAGDYGYKGVNVDAQRDDDESLLAWFERMLRALRECPECGDGEWTLLDSGLAHILDLRFDGRNGAMIAVSNLADQPSTIDLSADLGTPASVLEVFANRRYQTRPSDMASLDLDGWGYRWLRMG
jgi:glycosidase